MCISSCLFVTFVGLMGWPDVPWRAELNRELAKFRGTWVVETANNTTWLYLEQGNEIEFRTDDFRLNVKQGGEDSWLEGSGYFINLRTRPKNLNLGLQIGAFFGIYEFDGDRLRYCYTYEGQGTKERTHPTQFKADREKRHNLVILKRVKP